MQLDASLTLIVGPETQDGFVRIDLADMRRLGLSSGDVVMSDSPRRCLLRILPAFMEDRNQHLARVSFRTARNLGLRQGEVVRFLPERQRPPYAELVTLQAEDEMDRLNVSVRASHLCGYWRDLPVVVGDELSVPSLEQNEPAVRVLATQPPGPVLIGPATAFVVTAPGTSGIWPAVGGLREPYMACMSLLRARLKKDGSLSAGTVLLTGPAGCGKALMVHRLAHETEFTLRYLDAHQLIDQWLSRGTTDLALSLSEFARRGPTLILLDHLEALNEAHTSDSQIAVAALCVTAQIAGLLDEVPMHPNIVAFAVTSAPLPPRLLIDRRFDYQLEVDMPNRWGRMEILTLAVAGKALAEDVDLDELASMTPGCTPRELTRIVTHASLMAMDRKLARADFIRALRGIVPTAPGDVYCDVPSVAWEDVAGFDDVKGILKETLGWSLYQHDRFAAYGVSAPRSILLSGGQGTGKTSLVRALAVHMPMPFIEIACPYLVTRAPHEGGKILRSAFSLARRKAPCLIFFDDLDALFEGQIDPEQAAFTHPVVGQLIAELDTLIASPGVVVIAATKRLDRMTSEILQPGRFDFALTLPMPDQNARNKILRIHARKLPLAADVDFDKLASVTHGFTAADIANLCNRVGLMALRQSLSGPEVGLLPPVVNAELFDQALRGRKEAP